jgi:hypothetical protein
MWCPNADCVEVSESVSVLEPVEQSSESMLTLGGWVHI